MILFLYGSPGSGKTTLGKAVGGLLQCHHYDMDDSIPDHLKAFNKSQQPIPQDLFDTYFYEIFYPDVDKRARESDLVVSCVLARRSYRTFLEEKFPDSLFIQLTAPFEMLIERLETRDHFFGKEVLQQMSTLTHDWGDPTLDTSQQTVSELVQDISNIVRTHGNRTS